MSWDFEHIVVGAGISGLGAAHMAVRRGIGTLVLERGERVGGCMYSYPFVQRRDTGSRPAVIPVSTAMEICWASSKIWS